MLCRVVRQSVRVASTAGRVNVATTVDRRSGFQNSPGIASENDLNLIRRGDFLGVVSKEEPKIVKCIPEVGLTQLQESLRRNFRVQGENVLGIIIQLESGDAKTISAIRKSPEKWISLLISACGMPMSNLDNGTRQILLDRLWKQLEEHEIPVDIDMINKRMTVMLENDTAFSVDEELRNIQTERGLYPNQDTFRVLLERLARQGNLDSFESFTYKMASSGCVVDAHCHASLVYCYALRGHIAKADSLVEKTADKYDQQAYNLALGACARAAAARGDTNRLRQVLRRAVDSEERLQIPFTDVFDVIWQLACRNKQNHGLQNLNLIEQMLEHINRPQGFFRHLLREIERHVAHEHYYTAITLLEDTKRIADCLKNQKKSLFLHQVLGRLCRQMIRCKTPLPTVGDVANRVVAMFKDHQSGISIHDTLLYSSMMFRGFSLDERLDYLAALIDTVDSSRTRPHLMLPLMATAESLDDKLKILFRCSSMGYKDISQLDIGTLSALLLVPLYEKQVFRADLPRLNKCSRILKSYGITDTAIWNTYHSWWKQKSAEEARTAEESRKAPFASELQGWLRHHYSAVFENNVQPINPPINVTYERLKNIVDSRDCAKAVTFIHSYGWPKDTNYEEIVPSFLELVLDHEEWASVRNFIVSLSNQSTVWGDKSPLKNYHILRILRRATVEGNEVSVRQLMDLSYELKRMFPDSITEYDNFFNTLYEYNRLFGKIFERLPTPSVERIDECIDLLRILIKLELLALHPNETLTTMFINQVLKKLGWNEAVNTWMKFQSGLSCSNGIVALLRYCVFQKDDAVAKANVKLLIHKAQSFVSQSKVHVMYAAVLASMRKHERLDEAADILAAKKNDIDPRDCVPVLRLINALKYTNVDEEFNLKFPELCLKHTSLTEHEQAMQNFKAESMRICDMKNLAPLALQLFDLFKTYGAQFSLEEKKHLWEMTEKHDSLISRWMFEPQGLLRLREDDDIVTNAPAYRIKKELKSELDNLAAAV